MNIFINLLLRYRRGGRDGDGGGGGSVVVVAQAVVGDDRAGSGARASKEGSQRFHNLGEGPYLGFLLVESVNPQ